MRGYAVIKSRQANGVGGQRMAEYWASDGQDLQRCESLCLDWLKNCVGTYWQYTGDYQIVAVKKEDEMPKDLENTAHDAGQELGAALLEVISKVAVGAPPNMAALMALAKVFCSQQGYQGAEAVIAYVQGFGEGFQDGSGTKSVAQLTPGN